MNYKDITVSVFTNCKSNRSNTTMNIWEWLLLQKDHSDIIQMIRNTKDIGEIRRLKGMLQCATMSGIFQERKANKIETYSGLICIDIDGKDNPDIMNIESLKQTISQEIVSVLYCGLSVSGKGLFCLVPINNPQKHLEHYYALEKDFKNLSINIDPSCTDTSRLRFQSCDPKPYVNPKAVVYGKLLSESVINKTTRNNSNKMNKTHFAVGKQSVKEAKTSIKEMLLKPSIDITGDEITPVYPIYMYSDDDKRNSILRLIKRIVVTQTDITVTGKDWVTVGEVISRYFGESGRALFHQISQFYKTDSFHYTQNECDQKFNQILKSKYTYGYERIFEVSRKYGFS